MVIPLNQIQIRLDLRIPMRDGVSLYGVLYRPVVGKRFPVLLIRSPYDTQNPKYLDWVMRFTQNGYAIVLQDCRGRYESEGEFKPYVNEANDGYDTYEWLGQQPWCDGNIGTFGISYPGFTQLQPAPLRNPYVKALVPIANQEDNYGHLRYNGVLQLENAINFLWIGHHNLQHIVRTNINIDGLFRHLPLISALDEVADRPFYRETVMHSSFDDFWKSYSMKGKYKEVDVPALFITGWYDNLLHEGFKCFKGWTTQAYSFKTRKLSKLLVGPWTHTQIGSAKICGDINFGATAEIDIPNTHLRWYDQRLKGIDSGIDQEPPIKIFVMGANTWRFEQEWPLARTQYQKVYLHSQGKANSDQGDGWLDFDPPKDEGPDLFQYDPEQPVPSLGGQSMLPKNTGPRDRSSLECREDILVYSTKPLGKNLEVTGPILVRLFAASSALDTDFTATLVDVYSSGQAIHICEGIVRCRFRDSYESPTLIQPGIVYEYEIQLWETSNLFKTGHIIRLEISSSNFPRFDRNQNTGNPLGMDTEIQLATQTIYHNTKYPSHMVLPVIP